MSPGSKRTGAETKEAAQRVALSLFSSQGYEATSLRQIADRLGINKASLYFHFKNKEEIVASVLAGRAAEAQELLSWTQQQPRTSDLPVRAVLRWIDSMSVEKLRGIRFITANPGVLAAMGSSAGRQIRDGLGGVVDLLVGDEPDEVHALLIRMALLSINAAVSAAAGTSASDDDIVGAARQAAVTILAGLEHTPSATATAGPAGPADPSDPSS